MKKTGKFLQLLINHWWFRHLLFWIFIVNYLVLGLYYKGGDPLPEYIRGLKSLPLQLMVVYSTLYIFIPQFLVKKRFILFFLGFFGILSFVAYLTGVFNLSVGPKDVNGFDIRMGTNILPFIHVAGLATALKMIKFSYLQENKADAALHQKGVAELELLKAQIHPHFLFNTLNNLFAHTLRNSTDAPQIVLKLSELLRFMIYEGQDDLILLSKELQILKNYIDLEKLRYGTDLDISVSITGDIEHKLIRPLLLLPLIENSFKHGTSQQLEQKWITLDIKVDKTIMYFKLANSRNADQIRDVIPGKSKGIGLENVKRRLELLYPGKHHFLVRKEETKFIVSCDLNIVDRPISRSTQQVKISEAYDMEMSAGG